MVYKNVPSTTTPVTLWVGNSIIIKRHSSLIGAMIVLVNLYATQAITGPLLSSQGFDFQVDSCTVGVM